MIDCVREALQRGFAKEAQAYIKYQLYSQKARDEAKDASSEEQKSLLLTAAELFRHMAEDEFSHAHFYLNALGEITATVKHLEVALAAEQNDQIEYVLSSSAAQANSMEAIARQFLLISSAEKDHAQLCHDLSTRLQDLWFDSRVGLINTSQAEE